MVLGFDLQGAITLLAGLLLALITLFTGYDHVHLFWGPTFQLNQQIGLFVLAASLATLVVDAQLASRRRVRGARDRIQEQEDRAREADAAAEERNRPDQERERAARSEQRQARALRAGALVWLNPTPLNRRFLELVAAELAEGDQS